MSARAVAATPLDRLRATCLALPGVSERLSHGAPTFFAGKRAMLTYVDADSHHGGGRPSAWIKSTPLNQRFLLEREPARCFRPPYVGPSGWIGVWLDRRPRWAFVAELIEEGWRLAAPTRLGGTRRA